MVNKFLSTGVSKAKRAAKASQPTEFGLDQTFKKISPARLRRKVTMTGVPSTLTNSANDNGISSALNGLFNTGLAFLSDNLFGGEKEDQQATARKQRARQRQRQQSVLGTGISPGTLVGVGVVGLVAWIIFLSVRK